MIIVFTTQGYSDDSIKVTWQTSKIVAQSKSSIILASSISSYVYYYYLSFFNKSYN